eukprot:TRINITY_DN4988_c0_g1_i1.p1 TRINITY_DN4988_c0_g1~~TRINITY_DN4988_c0_g1_i1.p1  ORF type:complete len:771 (-),score=197.53 TRINITY_DN4988_c0_g1_i1:474-2786(-)
MSQTTADPGSPVDQQFPTVERFMLLLKRSLSKKPSKQLSDSDAAVLNYVKSQLRPDQWEVYTQRAAEERRMAKAQPKEVRRRLAEAEEQLVQRQLVILNEQRAAQAVVQSQTDNQTREMSELRMANQHLRSTNEQNIQLLTDAQTELNRLSSELDMSRARIRQLENSEEQHRSSVVTVQLETQRTSNQVDSLQTRLKQTETHRDALEKRVLELQARAPVLKSEVQSKVSALLAEQRDAIQQASRLVIENQDYVQRVSRLEAELAATRAQLDEARATIARSGRRSPARATPDPTARTPDPIVGVDLNQRRHTVARAIRDVRDRAKACARSVRMLKQSTTAAFIDVLESCQQFAEGFASAWAAALTAAQKPPTPPAVAAAPAATVPSALDRSDSNASEAPREHTGGIAVLCRVCGPDRTDLANLQVLDDQTVQLVRSHERRQFVFDGVFGNEARQEEMVEMLRPVIGIAVEGGKGCILAYGGPTTNRSSSLDALFAVVADDLFTKLSQHRLTTRVVISVSAIEVVGDSTRDLLAPMQPIQPQRVVRHDSSGRAFVPGLIYVAVANSAEVDRVITLAHSRRSPDPYNHMILTFALDTSDRVGDVTLGKLTVVVLASPEKPEPDTVVPAVPPVRGPAGYNPPAPPVYDAFAASKRAMRELSALGAVLGALSTRQHFIPFRNSRLTHVLADAMSPDSAIVLLLHVNAGSMHHTTTQATLIFGERARVTEVMPRDVKDSEDVKTYKKSIHRLKVELARADDVRRPMVSDTAPWRPA